MVVQEKENNLVFVFKMLKAKSQNLDSTHCISLEKKLQVQERFKK